MGVGRGVARKEGVQPGKHVISSLEEANVELTQLTLMSFKREIKYFEHSLLGINSVIFINQ